MGNYVSIEHITPGMTLVDPIVNKFGQVIIAAGVELQSHHIAKLKTWGVSHISVVAEEGSGPGTEMLEIAKERVDKRLLWTPRHLLEIDMYNAAIHLTAMKIVNGIKESA